MKLFKNELEKLFLRLQSGKKFAFSKYADGEWAAMQGRHVNNGEFNFDSSYFTQVSALKKSFVFKDDDYYVGISCPCCQGNDHQKMKEASGQDDDHLTFANIFVNANYPLYKDIFINEFKKNDIHLIANKKSKIENLPFKLENFYPIEYDAWSHNINIIDEILNQDLKNKLFLFCAGPFGNILAHQLWENNKKNVYLDIGSTLNPWLMSEGFIRGYLRGADTSQKICVWVN